MSYELSERHELLRGMTTGCRQLVPIAPNGLPFLAILLTVQDSLFLYVSQGVEIRNATETLVYNQAIEQVSTLPRKRLATF